MKFLALIINRNVRFLFSHQSKKKNFFKIENQQKQTKNAILPSQYPKNLTDQRPAIRRGRPIVYITPQHQIPQNQLVQNAQLINAQKYNGKWKSPLNAYSLNVGLIGPVNSGKSELLGKIIGKKLSAVSPKSNTTDQTIQGYKSFQIQSEQGLKNVQLKYYDTAGMMYRKTGFISKGWKVLSQIDFSLLVIDSTKKFDQMTREAIKRLQSHRNYQNFMKALVLNKIDLVQNRRKFHSLISQIQKYGKFDKIFYVSALTGYGVEQLQKYLINFAKKRQWQQPKEALTNLTQIQIYQQMLKQCIYHRSYKQVPYNTTIQCVSVAKKSNNLDQIRFKIIVESENQQRMMIGKEGRNIQWIINRFKVYFTQSYQKQAQVYVDVRIKKKSDQNQFLSDQTFFDQETQKKLYKQKIVAVQDYLGQQGKFRKQNMMQWNNFFQQQKVQTDKKLKLPFQKPQNLQLDQSNKRNGALPLYDSQNMKKRKVTSGPRKLRRSTIKIKN